MQSSGVAVEVNASPVSVYANLDFLAAPANFAVHSLLIQSRCID
jgi:hypothetical protein